MYCVIQQAVPNTLVILSPFFACGKNRRHSGRFEVTSRRTNVKCRFSSSCKNIAVCTLNVAVRAVSPFISLLAAIYTSVVYCAFPLFELFKDTNDGTSEISSLSNSLPHLCCGCLYTEMSNECRNHSYFIDALIIHVRYWSFNLTCERKRQFLLVISLTL